MVRTRARRWTTVIACAAAAASISWGLTACTFADSMPMPSTTATASTPPTDSSSPTPEPGSSETPAESNDPSPSTEPTDSSSPTDPSTPPPSDDAAPDDGATPVGLDCNEVLTPQQVYDFNANFGRNPDYSPRDLASRATSLDGVACSWLHQTSGVTLDVAVAEPSSETLDDLKSAAVAGDEVGGTPGTSYFAMHGDAGVSQTFAGGYWVVVSSDWFESAGDAGGIVSDVVGNLP